MSHLIAPSILTANFLKLGEAVEMVNQSEADWLHFDVMDGVFVPNLTFGFHVIRQVREVCRKPIDAHLMIVEPERHFERFVAAGVDRLTIHYETCPHLHRSIQSIRDLGMMAGVAINPHTPVQVLEDILPELDLVLNMTVNPGFGAQTFIENSYKKIGQLRKMIDERELDTLIQIDGGVNLENIGSLRDAGVDVFVVGNTVFSSDNPPETIRQLKSA